MDQQRTLTKFQHVGAYGKTDFLGVRCDENIRCQLCLMKFGGDARYGDDDRMVAMRRYPWQQVVQ